MPFLARAADALAAWLLAVAAWIALTGGSRYILFDVVLSFRSTPLFLFAAASVLFVRHVLVPRPSALDGLRELDAAITARPALASALRPFLATRILVLAVGFVAVVAIGPPESAEGALHVSNDPLIDLPARYDAGWYGLIAIHGYSWGGGFTRQQDIAFFPALPILMRGGGAVVGAFGPTMTREMRLRRVLWVGVGLAFAAFLGALYYFVRLGETLVGPERAHDAALLLATYPFAVFYSAPYTEALYLLAAVGATFHFLRRDWWSAAAWGLLAGLCRPNGFVLAAPLGLLALQQAWHLKGTGWRGVVLPLAVASAPVAGMLLFTLYLYRLTGHWFAWAKSHAAWGRSFGGLEPFAAAWDQLSRMSLAEVVAANPAAALNSAGVLFAVLLTWPVVRRLGIAWGAFILLSIAGPLAAGGVLSLGRLTSTLFPLFLALAIVLPRRAVPACAVAFAVLQGLAAVLFFTWRDLY